MSGELKLQSLSVENWRNIKHVSINTDGKHIILSGPSGSGKTAISQALRALFFGARALPAGELIREGESGASAEVMLGDGKQQRYRATLSVTKKGEYWSIKEIDEAGKARPWRESPIEFFKRIASPIMFDAKRFFSTDSEALQLLLDSLPGLEEKLVANDAELAKEQQARSDAMRDADRSRMFLEALPEVAGLPDVEIDVADLVEELEAIRARNRERDAFAEKIVRMEADAKREQDALAAMDADLDRKTKIIEQMQRDAEILRDTLTKRRLGIDIAQMDLGAAKIGLAETVTQSTAETEEKIAKLSDTNAKIRSNRKRVELAEEAEKRKAEAQKRFVAMKAIEAARVDLLRGANIPVPGLTIGDKCLMYPDPSTLTPVPLSALSDGQKWPVVTRLYTALCPAMRLLYIDDFTAIDAKCREAMFAAAEHAGLQLLIHQTTQTADEKGLGISIVDGEIAE